jgi:nucleoside-diphosphate-sugar epimerase
MTKKRIFFTGGSGKAGKHVIPYLLKQGHRVMNVDLAPLNYAGVDNLSADITDSGEMFNAMSSYAGLDELELGNGVPRFDAVVHFAAVPRILIKPDNETFRINTIGTYNVIEAAVKLGIKKIIIASSETTYGMLFRRQNQS